MTEHGCHATGPFEVDDKDAWWHRLSTRPITLGLVLLGTVVASLGYGLGVAAGDPTREVSGVVDVFNREAIGLVEVSEDDDGVLAASLVVAEGVQFETGDTVRGTLIESAGVGTIFVLQEVVPTPIDHDSVSQSGLRTNT